MTTKAAETAQRRGGQDDDEFDQFSDPVDDVWVPTVDYRINHILLAPQPSTVGNHTNLTTERLSPSEGPVQNKNRKPRVPPAAVAVRKKEQRRAYHEKSKSIKSGGLTLCCSICGRHNFETESGAARHQAECDGQSNAKGPWKCSVCGKNKFSTSQAFAGHWRCCNKGRNVTKSSLSLRPDAFHNDYLKLSDFSQIIADSIELFAATEADVERQVVGNGRRKIEVGNIGIRCRQCAKNGVLTVGSISYPNDLKTFPHNMYSMTKRHLMGNCQSVSYDLQQRLQLSKQCSTSQSMQKGAIGLPAYVRILTGYLDLTDDGKTEGVYQRTPLTSHEEFTQSPTSINTSEEADPIEIVQI